VNLTQILNFLGNMAIIVSQDIVQQCWRRVFRVFRGLSPQPLKVPVCSRSVSFFVREYARRCLHRKTSQLEGLVSRIKGGDGPSLATTPGSSIVAPLVHHNQLVGCIAADSHVYTAQGSKDQAVPQDQLIFQLRAVDVIADIARFLVKGWPGPDVFETLRSGQKVARFVVPIKIEPADSCLDPTSFGGSLLLKSPAKSRQSQTAGTLRPGRRGRDGGLREAARLAGSAVGADFGILIWALPQF
jgi:hypothetical protein